MNHSFNVDIATKYGMLEAVLLEYLNFWVTKNKANGVQFYDGHYWTYNSAKALAELFPYASKATIHRALHCLEDKGLVLSGNYNKSTYDRTTWYTLTEKGSLLIEGRDTVQDGDSTGRDNKDVQDISQSEKCIIQNETSISQNEKCIIQNETSISQNDNIHFSKCVNGFAQSETTIPVINTVIDTDINLTVSNDTVRRTDVQRVTEHWNQLAVYGVKPVCSINHGTKRFDMLGARIRTYSIEKVLEAIENIKKSAFLCGGGQKGWVITFDWFVRPNNFIKVLEGNYEGMENSDSMNKNSPVIKPNQFNSFQQRDYDTMDIDNLERRLLAK